jgi:YegS/Rv2252/BmrU family lipid kinase
VLAAGGDGTLNEAVNGIAGSETALAPIPGGTANVWAVEAGVPTHPASVAAMVERGRRVRVDLGIAGGRYFLLMASAGLDSLVASTVTAQSKSRRGRRAYIGDGLRKALHYRGVQAEISADGWSWRGPLLLALLGNTRSYGSMISIAHRADATDGLLDLVVYRSGGPLGTAAHLVRTMTGTHAGRLGAEYRRVREAEISTVPAVPVQADGEIIGETPMRFGIAPRALRLIVPAGARIPALDGGRGWRAATS